MAIRTFIEESVVREHDFSLSDVDSAENSAAVGKAGKTARKRSPREKQNSKTPVNGKQ